MGLIVEQCARADLARGLPALEIKRHDPNQSDQQPGLTVV